MNCPCNSWNKILKSRCTDAMTGGEHTAWSRDNFLFQRRWLMEEEAGLEQITTNKNHYLRWEALDFTLV